MIKVYLWDFRSINCVGHLTLELSDRTYISFWPDEDPNIPNPVRKKRSVGATSYNRDVANEGRRADEVLELPDDIVDQEKIKLWWKGYVADNKYHMFANNCAFVVREALLVGGIFQTQFVEKFYGSVFTPRETFEWIKACKDLYPRKQRQFSDVVEGLGYPYNLHKQFCGRPSAFLPGAYFLDFVLKHFLWYKFPIKFPGK